ncbi:transcriptional regulator, partial [Streptococcus anginosus]|uniref:transcriptional regulator n=1 Tax=Streptococcus anginosus TaxID=1328 RepID=UPI003854CE69|nr:hypothetical protein [Streptococcus anginosus]
RGLLLYILSKPDDWDIYLDELIKNSSSPPNRTKTAFKELIKAGYIYRIRCSMGYKRFKWFRFASDKKMNPQTKSAFDKQVKDDLLSSET